MLRAQARTFQRESWKFFRGDGWTTPAVTARRASLRRRCRGTCPCSTSPSWDWYVAGGKGEGRRGVGRAEPPPVSFVRSFVPHTGCAPAVSLSLSLSRSLAHAHAPPRCSGPATLTRISPLPRSPTPNSHAASLGAITHTQGSIVGAGIYVVIGFTAKDIAGPGIGTRSRCCSCCCSCRCRASFGCTSWPAV